MRTPATIVIARESALLTGPVKVATKRESALTAAAIAEARATTQETPRSHGSAAERRTAERHDPRRGRLSRRRLASHRVAGRQRLAEGEHRRPPGRGSGR